MLYILIFFHLNLTLNISDKMIKKIIFTLFFLCTFGISFSQITLSKNATVSVLTCGPGNQLYTTFGHSAFRINDPIIGLDKVYNYGTFDFNAPNFYLNFAKGKLTYQLSTTRFQYFLAEYHYENRWVKSQVLNLTPTEVSKVFDFLENNAKPENKNYQYDFFFDNCSTKIEAVLKAALPNKIEFNNTHINTIKTHRDLIADYTQNQPWGKFGIDLALGSVIDKAATKDEYKFLPDYIFKALENATIKSDSLTNVLVKNELSILKEKPVNQPFFKLTPSPFITLLLVSCFIFWMTYKNFKNNQRSKFLDFLLFFTTGSIGIIVLLLWFATSHTATYKNLNFLWAFAPNLVVAFYLLKTKLPNWIKLYNEILCVLLIILCAVWIAKIQVFNSAFISLFLALCMRYLYIISTFKKQKL